ncbi:MAG: TolC family protein [Candidatus Omnitrophica bacterium]|nr:TolC family protein [Candidatus Omnitrophota bacterium]
MRNYIILYMIFTFFCCGSARCMAAAAAEGKAIVLTLDEALAIALRDNRDIRLKAQDVENAKLKIAEARSGLLPALSFTGTWNDTRGYYAKDIAQTTTQTTLKQYLYKGGKTINTIKQKENEFEVSQALLDKEKLELALDINKSFYTLALADEFAYVNQKILENIRVHLAVAKERYKNGQASESDILNMEASLSSARQEYEASLNQAEAAEELLKNLLYLEKEARIRPDAEFGYEPQEIAYDLALLKAISARPEIRQYEAQLKADKNAVEIAKADNRPSIYASWDYYSRSTASLTFSPGKGWQDYNIIGLTFSWPVFDGWAAKARVGQALIGLKQTQLTKEKAVKDIVLELRNAYLALQDAISKIQAVESDTALYKDNLETAEEKYEEGIASALDVDDSAVKYDITAFNKKQAIYDYIIAKASFDKATGGI